MHVPLPQRNHSEAKIGIAATEGVTGIFGNAERFFGNIEGLREFADFSKAPRHEAARERGGQDKQSEAFADEAAFEMGGGPAELFARLDVVSSRMMRQSERDACHDLQRQV